MAGVLHLDLPSSCWEAPPRGLSLFPWAGARVLGQMPHGAGLTATCASGLSPGTWSNRFRSPPPPAARGSFRPGDAESPDPGPADPQPRHEGGDRRVHLGERLGGGLLRGWGQRCPPGCPGTAGSPWAGTMPYSLSGSSPSGPAAPGLAPGEGTSPCPLPEEPQRLGGHHGSLAPLSCSKTCLGVGMLAPQQWPHHHVHRPLSQGSHCPQRARPAPGIATGSLPG